MGVFDLVFEGGGAKGTAFVGAIEEFEQRGHTARRFVGTSAGAITATLMAAGYNAKAMKAATTETLPNGKPRFSSFMDIAAKFAPEDIKNSLTYTIFRNVDLPLIPDSVENRIDSWLIDRMMKIDAYREIFSFVERGGLYAGDAFLAWLREKLNNRISGLGNLNFKEFSEQTNSDLSVVASDTSSHDMLILNSRTAPQCPVAWGVRMSMSIPFLWQEVRWQKDWGTYRGRDITGHIIVDGGVLSNFPIYYLTSDDDEVQAVMGSIDPNACPNLGLLIDETVTVPGALAKEDRPDSADTDDGLLNHITRLKTIQRVTKILDTLTDAHDRAAIAAHQDEVCRLPAKGYGTTEFDMSAKRLDALIAAGKDAMKNHLSARGF
ncbi:patatin-like phospholipase family protein [Geobacter pelophilus]|uniref:Patatin-like phospholipase family protein n=1 Tax=Geoanaerobacter pelophilus TaxID=60036 RepID=A0AAW4L5H3_9BACT|nr:patatin-like phospholipase family protein [Geoanaerobacter pelophilus]MBT0666029.1 patatin-like phospholipase family protein [Geoanaerobacter pelophilus]